MLMVVMVGVSATSGMVALREAGAEQIINLLPLPKAASDWSSSERLSVEQCKETSHM